MYMSKDQAKWSSFNETQKTKNTLVFFYLSHNIDFYQIILCKKTVTNNDKNSIRLSDLFLLVFCLYA